MTPSTAHPANTAQHVVWFPPPFFHTLPLDAADADEAADRLYALTTDLLPTGTEEERLRMYLAYGNLLDDLRAAGADYAGFCVLDMEGRPSTASLAMYRMTLEDCKAADTCAETYEALLEAYPEDDVRVIDLPHGEAVVHIGDEPLLVPAELSPNGIPVEMLRGLIQVFSPSPDGAEIAVLELGTPAMEDWEFYSELFADIVKTWTWVGEEEFLFLSEPSGRLSPSDCETAALVRELHACSSEVLDTLALHGQVNPENRLSNVTCPDCLVAGCRSPCAFFHEWLIDTANADESVAAMRRCRNGLFNRGWHETGAAATQGSSYTAAHRTGYKIGVSSSPSGRHLLIKVLTPCLRADGDAPDLLRHRFRPGN